MSATEVSDLSSNDDQGKIQGDQNEIVSPSRARNFFKDQEQKLSKVEASKPKGRSLSTISNPPACATHTIKRAMSEDFRPFKPVPPAPAPKSHSMKYNAVASDAINESIPAADVGIPSTHGDRHNSLPVADRAERLAFKNALEQSLAAGRAQNTSPSGISQLSLVDGTNTPSSHGYTHFTPPPPPQPPQMKGIRPVNATPSATVSDTLYSSGTKIMGEISSLFHVKKDVPRNIICVGNPGTGKSTLLNSMLEKIDPTRQYGRFKSGVSIAKGLTYELNTIKAGKIHLMDTPGLADVKLRKQAAVAIHDALKKGGKFQVLVVVTLESGRVKPDDAATAKLVLDSAPDIKQFGVIFNKVTKGVKRELENDPVGITELTIQIQPQSEIDSICYPLVIMRKEELDDEPNVSTLIPELEEFQDALPYMNISPDNVKHIQDETFDQMREMMESQLQELKDDRAMMQAKIKEMQEKLEAALKQNAKGGVLSRFFMKIGL